MLTKDNVTIGIEWRFGTKWPGKRCGGARPPYCRLNYAEIQRSFENNQTASLKMLATYFQELSPAVSQGQERMNNSPRQI